jgi:hypothetical protein
VNGRTHWRRALMLGAVIVGVVGMGGCGFPFLDLIGGGGGLLPQGPEGPEGPQGPEGPEGPAGPAGQDGLNAGATLPDTVVTILSVNDGATVNPGDDFVVTFTVEDGDGDTIYKDQLDRYALRVAGPVTGYQRVITDIGDMDALTQDGEGVYTFTAPSAFPSVYAAPEEDSPDITAGELTGQALMNGTYTVGVEARRTFNVEGASVRKADDDTYNFLVGGGTLMSRELVTRANCNVCHVDLQAHGGNRHDLTGCLLCHTAGSEDLISDDPDKATTGVTVEFATMIHRIHMGRSLPYVAATAEGADPYEYLIIGYRESVNDYSDVAFPVMPGGTGFDEQMRNCDACHGGAADEAEIYADDALTQKNCQSCHQDIDFDTGTILNPDNADVGDGVLTEAELDDATYRTEPGGISHILADGSCVLCHGAGRAWDAEEIHVPPLLRADVIDGLTVEITDVTGNANAGFFAAGDAPVITFNVVDKNGDDFPIDDLNVNLVLSGPTDNYQRILPLDGTAASTVTLKGAGGVPATGTGPFTYTSPDALPANFPAPFGDSAAFTYADGWGELSGRPLAEGTYTVMIYAYQEVTVDGTAYRETTMPGLYQIRVGSAGDTEAYAGVVTDDTCNSCHGDLRFHGNTRRGIENCVVCHTAGAEDRENVLAGQTQAAEDDSIDWKVMIHKIHAARNLAVVQDGGVYDIVGYAFGQPLDTGNVQDFSNGILPAMPQEAAACTTCHADDSWYDIQERDDVNIWKVACTSCHDSTAAAVHVSLNTGANVGEEGCAVCHGDGAAFSVQEAHAAP